jgi:Protein of unknown function (DUF3106)
MMLRALLAVLALCVAAAAGAQPGPDTAKKPAAKTAKKVSARPAWAELTAEQQLILAPLRADWDLLEVERRHKWVAIAKRYPRMAVQEQERVQRRMQAWANLTPEQRRQARENYKQLAKLPRETHTKNLREQWAEYQALSPQERQSLAPATSLDPRRPKH